MLDVFGNAELNRYWIYGVLELVLVRLAPELESRSWSELMRERGVEVDGEGVGEGDVNGGGDLRQ